MNSMHSFAHMGKAAAAALALAITLSASTASASTLTGYLCNVSHIPYATSTSYGSEGYVHTYVYAQPNCAGSYLGFARFYSEGASAANAPEQQWLLSAITFPALYSNLARAAAEGQKVVIDRLDSNSQARTVAFQGH